MVATGRPDAVTLQFDVRMAAWFVSEHGPYFAPFFCFFYGHKSSQLADFEDNSSEFGWPLILGERFGGVVAQFHPQRGVRLEAVFRTLGRSLQFGDGFAVSADDD